GNPPASGGRAAVHTGPSAPAAPAPPATARPPTISATKPATAPAPPSPFDRFRGDRTLRPRHTHAASVTPPPASTQAALHAGSHSVNASAATATDAASGRTTADRSRHSANAITTTAAAWIPSRRPGGTPTPAMPKYTAARAVIIT